MNAHYSNSYGDDALQATAGGPNTHKVASAGTHNTTAKASIVDTEQKGIDNIRAALKEEAKALDDREKANFKRTIELEQREDELTEREIKLMEREQMLGQREMASKALSMKQPNAASSSMYSQYLPSSGMDDSVNSTIGAQQANEEPAIQPSPGPYDPASYNAMRNMPYPYPHYAVMRPNYVQGMQSMTNVPNYRGPAQPPHGLPSPAANPGGLPPTQAPFAPPVAPLPPPQKDADTSTPAAASPTAGVSTTTAFPFVAPNQQSMMMPNHPQHMMMPNHPQHMMMQNPRGGRGRYPGFSNSPFGRSPAYGMPSAYSDATASAYGPSSYSVPSTSALITCPFPLPPANTPYNASLPTDSKDSTPAAGSDLKKSTTSSNLVAAAKNDHDQGTDEGVAKEDPVLLSDDYLKSSSAAGHTSDSDAVPPVLKTPSSMETTGEDDHFGNEV